MISTSHLTLFIMVISSVFLLRCNGGSCDDCDPLRRNNFALINKINSKLELVLKSDKSEMLPILEKLDTTMIWSVTMDPTISVWNVLPFNTNSLSYVDTIDVNSDGRLLRRFIRRERDEYSLFNALSYRSADSVYINGRLSSLLLFDLDSTSLFLD